MKKVILLKKNWHGKYFVVYVFSAAAIFFSPLTAIAAPDNSSPPKNTVKLVFIHHSCGENWLTDNHGNLGKGLDKNNYFVSDTNYGWGPHSIGDSTDITDWPRWFTSSESKRYLSALYKQSGKNSSFTRRKADTGGENQIIMFKSCFPNSNLEGKPNDRPRRGDGFTVSNAKAIYNEILKYFKSMPDKLFIAVTAPPVQDRSLAANARAFNNWLVDDWLKGYKGTNVAVFDFYNVLTGPKNHHRFRNGKVEHVTVKGRNTLCYPSNGDDHPSPKGNKKATAEIIPLINVFYHRWKAGQGFFPPTGKRVTPEVQSVAVVKETQQEYAASPEPESSSFPVIGGDVLDNFEDNINEWVVFSDEAKSRKQLVCGREVSTFFRGKAGLSMKYNIDPESWATCSLVFPGPKNWKSKKGISLYIRAEREGQSLHIVVYQGESSDDLAHFEYKIRTSKKAVNKWLQVDISWDAFAQPSWQGDGSAMFDPGQAMGIAFAFDTPDGEKEIGRIWVDDICFLSE